MTLRRLYAPSNAFHYHIDAAGIRRMVGSRDAGSPWFGQACPPSCPGLGTGETFEPAESYWRGHRPAARGMVR